MIISQEQARRNMLDCQLTTNSVQNRKVLAALNSVPRENFVPDEYRKNAYLDDEIALEDGALILSPIAYGRMLEVANLESYEKVLDIGCASGYSSAVLAMLCKKVVAVENSTKLVGAARSNIEKIGIENVEFVRNDHVKGSASNGLYDKIFINGQVEQVPEGLIAQLKPGGKIITIMRVEADGMRPFIVSLRLDKKGVVTLKTHFQANSGKLPEFIKDKSFVF